MSTPELSIILVDYKSKTLLFESLKSIKEHVKNISYEIIVVDNNQEQESKIFDNELHAILPTANCLLLTADNRGFGFANNLAAKNAKGEYLLLLNPDTLIYDDSINKMLTFIKNHDEIGALSCLMGPDKKTLQKNFFGKFQSLASVTIRRYNYQKIDTSKSFFFTDIVTGACLMIKKEVYDKTGGFDEKFFMYLEDDDLCKRLVDAGYKNAILNTARIIHLEGKSISKNAERKKVYYKSQDLYWQKHNGTVPTLIMKLLRWPLKILQTNK